MFDVGKGRTKISSLHLKQALARSATLGKKLVSKTFWFKKDLGTKINIFDQKAILGVRKYFGQLN